jgi:hypothetical protein
MQVQSALFFETPAEIFRRVFSEIKPRTSTPEFVVLFRRYANANSFIRLENNRIEVKMADLLEGAPAPVMEALAWILLSKLFRKPVPRAYAHRFRLWLNRRDVRRDLHLVRQLRGRKFLSSAEGRRFHLDELFEDLNQRFFNGLLARPSLSWSKSESRTLLGHWDPSHNAIVISRILDRPSTPRIAVEYVLFHEMLHLRFPAEHRGARRNVHTRQLREAEKAFPHLAAAKAYLKHL